jgi:hypothetical protein
VRNYLLSSDSDILLQTEVEVGREREEIDRVNILLVQRSLLAPQYIIMKGRDEKWR